MRKLITYLKPFRLAITVVVTFIFLQTLADLYLPTLMADIVDHGVVNQDIPYIWKIGGIMLIVSAIGVACSITASYFSARVATGFGRSLRNKIFSHVENFSLQEFNKIGTASLITRTTNDINQLQQVLIMVLRMMIMAPLMSIGGIVMAISRDAKLSLIFVVIIPILALAIFLIVRKGLPLFKAMQKKLDRLNLILRENLTGIRVVRAFNRIEHEKRRFGKANLELTDTAIKVNQIMALLMPLMMLTLNISTIAIVWLGGIRIDHGNMQVGDLMAFIQYAMLIMFSLMMMSMMFIMIPRASVSADRVNEVLEMEPEIVDPEIEKQSSKQGYVEYRNVTFSYPGAEKPVLSNISFQTGPGEVTAIIGGTGSGKSTLIHLLPRFYEIDSGMILIDGVDIREMTQENLRSKIGLVPQKAVLFTGSVADNIRYGNELATDEQVRHAAEIAQAAEFIAHLEDGYDSQISQGGMNVSGGQKQRLSIARALVRKPEVYIFDDSFSALDYKTDAKLRAALKAETQHATVLIVAQRVSTVMDADRIIVLHHGKIVGNGTHEQLLKTNAVYQEIVSSQLAEEEAI